MKFELEPLPYPKDALEPYISAKTLDFHYDKHHRGYLEKLKAAIGDKPEGDRSLEEIIRSSASDREGGVYDNAAQVWNHTFYWKSMAPRGGGEPGSEVGEALRRDFGSYRDFQHQLSDIAAGHFGSGWAWLVADGSKRLKLVDTHDADNPLTRPGETPILTIDLWEHAYYLDYQNERAKYLEGVIEKLLNWEFAQQNYQRIR